MGPPVSKSLLLGFFWKPCPHGIAAGSAGTCVGLDTGTADACTDTAGAGTDGWLYDGSVEEVFTMQRCGAAGTVLQSNSERCLSD